jgi:programmed cell death 8 (apoptosis-inducing factor)
MKSIYQQDPLARVLIVSAESQIPYMRPPLSKELWQGEKSQSDVSTIKFKDWGGSERSLYFEDASSYSVVKSGDSVEY